VLDAHAAPAGGASGLPAGLLVPHVSPDNSLLSRLSRSGVRATLQQAQALLKHGLDWQASGVLERRLDGSSGLPADWPEAGRDWSQPASATQLQNMGSGPETACWHLRAGWVKPASLVNALLAQPGISWRGNVEVTRMEREPGSGLWQLYGSQGELLAQTNLVVLAAAYACGKLLQRPLPLQAIRGQLSWGLQPTAQSTAGAAARSFPDFPVNGHGSFLSGVPTDEGLVWLAGAGFTRDRNDSRIEPQDQLDNLARLQVLLPGVAAQLAADFQKATVRAWAGVRCASPDRLPLVGPVDPAQQAGLWINSAMGSRGLSFAVLCAELLAARLHHEPLPLDTRMAQALSAQRFSGL
jgi:tRNA 5-methylaminomethyl-2-thiouridine biosynthesis bifunctional protein